MGRTLLKDDKAQKKKFIETFFIYFLSCVCRVIDNLINAMPASSTDNICQIEETLKSSLKKRGDLDSNITSSSKKILLTQIEFKPAEKPYSLQIDSLRKKYISLNPQQNLQVDNGLANKSKYY